jgi:nitroimidazol reductase NimA-like FMN-containing flavoprotein (pyridoxamine 5'-phosphate oxidase superfamily)
LKAKGCFSMERYHLRRTEKAMSDQGEIEQVLASVRIMTVACCLEDEPYLFTVDFAWDPETRDLWFHCSTEGRKMKILQANPRVCVTVIEDRGYLDGECDHAYRSLILEGKVQLVIDLSEKRHALELLTRKHESHPEVVLARLAGNDESMQKVGIVRVSVDSISGKQGPAPKK